LTAGFWSWLQVECAGETHLNEQRMRSMSATPELLGGVKSKPENFNNVLTERIK